MATIDTEVTQLENALRAFVQTIKRPQQWAYVTAAAGVQLDRPAAVILQTLILHEPSRLGVQDLAMHLGIEPPSVTRKTQELERAGYLRRLRNEQDRRAVSLEVTEEGHHIASKLWQAQRTSMITVLKQWPADDRQRFVNLFERFAKELGDVTHNFEHTLKKGA